MFISDDKGPIVTLDEDGSVTFEWERIEALAESGGDQASDVCKLLVAVRQTLLTTPR
jgi:hypothetical protein